MDILGIGLPELVFILLLMLVVLGPKDMVKTGRQAGKLIRRLVKSPMWGSMMEASREIRELPTRLVRESGLDEDINEIRKTTQTSINLSGRTKPMGYPTPVQATPIPPKPTILPHLTDPDHDGQLGAVELDPELPSEDQA